jgi:sugar phosphate isomerase/epimerase
MDVLWQDTDPELVGWEIDTAWATKGGWDPVAMLREQADRVVAVHAKEIRMADESEPPMGEGDVDFAAIVELAKRHGWPLVIEYEGDPAPAGVAQSASYLKSLLEEP